MLDLVEAVGGSTATTTARRAAEAVVLCVRAGVVLVGKEGFEGRRVARKSWEREKTRTDGDG